MLYDPFLQKGTKTKNEVVSVSSHEICYTKESLSLLMLNGLPTVANKKQGIVAWVISDRDFNFFFFW